MPDCIDYPLELRLTQPLNVGSFAFAIEADLPATTPEVNTFDLILRDQDNNVMDAYFGLAGKPLVQIYAETPSLAWSRADPGQNSVITVGFTLTRDTINIRAVLITMPMGFLHDVQKPTEVQSLNRLFPVRAGSDWSDTSEQDAIKILLDDSDATTSIPAGLHRFSFPVQVPSEIPSINIWYLSLCDDIACKDPSDRSALVSFPSSGFNLYELAPENLRVQVNTARQQWHCGWHVRTPFAAAVTLLGVMRH